MLRKLALAAVLAGGAAGCMPAHELGAPARMPAPRLASCTIGVARFADETGLDLALDLRDYLRQNGPCTNVFLVSGPDDARADVVVSGEARVRIARDTTPAGTSLGSAFTATGIALAAAGGVLAGVNALRSDTTQDDKDVHDAFATGAKIGLIAGGALFVLGVSTFIADSEGVREMKAKGHIEAEVDITRAGTPLARISLQDNVVSRERHPRERPESRDTMQASGPLYREFYRRIFEHIAARLADVTSS